MSRLSVYEGCEPYIFISYAHRNSELVLPIIERLIADGYRVWYDDGIVPGSEWDEYIAKHIKQSSCMISMLSKEYMESNNCKDELKFARNMNKEQFLIYLSPTALTDGMQMRLDTLQAVFKYAYENEDDFYAKLYKADMLDCCKVESVPVTDNALPTPPAPETPETPPAEPLPHCEEHAEAALPKPQKPKKAGKIIVISVISLLLVASILFVAIGNTIPLIAPYAERVQSLLGFHKDTPETETADTSPRETVASSTHLEPPGEIIYKIGVDNLSVISIDQNSITNTDGYNGLSVKDDYVTITPCGDDPYYYLVGLDKPSPVTGSRYLAIKYRTATADGCKIQIYISSYGVSADDQSGMLEQPIVSDGEWHLAVFDMDQLLTKLDENYSVSFLRLDPLSGDWLTDENGDYVYTDESASQIAFLPIPEGCSIDIAYVAFYTP